MPVVATGCVSTGSELLEDPQAPRNSPATIVRNASLMAAKILETFMIFPTDLNMNL
jgi:molybdopterin biosynthesis enzyme